MERPDLEKPLVGPARNFRMVARTQSIEEADRIAEQYRMQGYETKIIKKRQGAVALYEVWAGREADILTGR